MDIHLHIYVVSAYSTHANCDTERGGEVDRVEWQTGIQNSSRPWKLRMSLVKSLPKYFKYISISFQFNLFTSKVEYK